MAEKDFRVKKGLAVEGTGNSTITGKLAIGSEETGGPSTSHSNILRISGDTNTNGIAKTSVPQLLVKTQNNGQDALVTIRGRRNGSTVSNQAVLQFGNHDDNATGGGTQVEFSALGAIAGRVSDSSNNIGDMVFVTYADGATASDRMIIKGGGNVGIGTTAPEALLDVNTGSGIAIQMGADVNATTLTNDTRKFGRFATPHYHNAEEPMGLIVGDSDGTDNIVNIGGGSNAVNAATSIRFWSAATDDTVTGTERMRIDSAGKVGIGEPSPSYNLHVAGSGYFTDDLRVGAETPSKITLNGNDAFVQGQFEASGSAGSYIYSLALGGETPTTTSGEILGAKATFSGASTGDYEALKLVNTNDSNDAAVTVLHMSNKRGVDSAFFLEHDAYGNTKMFTGQGSNVATSAGSDMNLGISILESGAVRLSDAFTFPTSIGSSGQVLKVPSTGSVLEWANDDSSAGGASALNGLTDVLVSKGSLFANNFGSAPVTGTLSTDVTEALDNIGIGDTALNDLTSGNNNLALVSGALTSVTTGDNNIGLGYAAGGATTGSINYLVGIGYAAARNMDGDNNIAIGQSAMQGSSTNTNNTGANNVGIGYLALYDITSADRNVAIGYAPLQNVTTGGYNVAIGNNTLGSVTTGTGNVAIGSGTADLLTDGASNVAIGAAMGDVDTGIGYNVALGYRAGRYLGSDDNVAIGKDALVGSSTATDNTGTRNVAIGKNAMDEITSGSDNVAIGFHAAGSFTSSANSVAVGREALSTITSGTANTAVGYQAGKNLTGTGNVAFGPQALLGLSSGTIDGGYNLAMGYQPMWEIQGGDYNVALGFEAMQNIRSGGSNIAIGRETMKEVDDDAIHNIALGYQAGYYIGENYGIAIGYGALKGSSTAANNTGLRNTAIGYTALESFTTGDDNIAIGNNALGDITTGEDNIAIGQSAGAEAAADSIAQIFLGRNSGYYMGGNANIGIGDNNVRGSSTVGDNTGTYNVGVGHFNLSVITTGSDNIGLGQLALRNVSTGNQNIGIGHDAGTAITTGSGNILIGKDSGDSIVDGSYNVLIGEDAGQDITSGDDNLIIHAGDNSADAPSSATADRQLRISSGSHVWFYGYDGNLYLGRNHLQRFPASGTDISGSDLEIGGSAGTGTGDGGDIKLQYSPPAASTGSTNNAHVDAITISGATGDVTIHKNLTVSGTTTTLNTENMTVEDKNIVLGSGNATAEVVDGTGLTLEGGTGDDITFQYNTTDDRMELKHGTAFEDFKAGTVTGTFVGGLTGDVTGNVSGSAATVTGAAQTNITSLGTLTSLAISGDLTVDTSTLKVDSTNNRVGIGTTAPDQKLHVEGSILADAYNFATTTLASDYTDGDTSLVLTSSAEFAAAGSGTINGVKFTWTANDTSTNTLTVPDLDADYTTGVTVVADTGLFFRDGFENAAQPSVTIYDQNNSGASRDDLSLNANAAIRMQLASNAEVLLTDDKLSLTPGNEDVASFVFRNRSDLGMFESGYNLQLAAPENVYIQIDSNNNNPDTKAFVVQKNANGVGGGTELFRVGEDGKVGIDSNNPLNKLVLAHSGADGDNGMMIVRADSTTANNDLLGGIGFDSSDGNAPSSVLEASAAIVAKARQDHSATEKGGYMEFMFSPTNQDDDTTSSVGMTFMDGKLAVNNYGVHPLTSLSVFHTAADFNDGITVINRNTTIADGDLLGAIGFDSRDGNAPSRATEASAGIAAYAAEDHSTGDKGGDLVFFTSAIDDDDDTASNERMRIDSEGKVGIGTTSPVAPLTVQTATNDVEALRIQNSAGNPGATQGITRLGISSRLETVAGAQIIAKEMDVADYRTNMIFATKGTNVSADPVTERMTIKHDGNVGIGTTSPTFPLHLKYTDNDTTPEGGSTSGSGTIGASAEGGGLYIENASTTDGSYAGITFRTDTADARIAWQSVGSSLINEGQMSFYLDTNDADSNTPSSVYTLEEVLRLRGGSSDSDSAQAFNSAYVNGRLGVGTASPNAELEVDGTIKVDPTGTYSAVVGSGSDTSTTAGIVFDGNADLFRESNGYLRRIIGANSATLTIGQDGTSIWNTIDLIPGHSGKIRLYSDNSDATTNSAELTMTIDDAKVGIGTASPNQPLTVEGTMSLKEQASANADTAAYGQLWVKTATPNELYFTTDAGDDIQLTSGTSIAGGGGGSGDIEGVTAGTGLSGGGTTGTVTLDIDLPGLSNVGESINNSDSIFIYNASISSLRKTTFGGTNSIATWIGDNVSELRIRDARNEGSTTSSEMLPTDFADKSATFTFTDDVASSTNTWDSVITMKGWSDSYRVWQIFSASDSSSNSVDTEPLYFRSGENDVNSGNWGVRREILTFPGTTPNADGSANQILQTDGSGALSWADISAAPSGFAVTGDLNVGSGDLFVDDSAGRVGIGAGTSPDAKLHVNGNMLLGSVFDKPTGSTFDAADAQLILGGAFNAEFNTGTDKAHLLISSHDNDDGTALYPIFVQDENVGNNSDAITGADFFIKNRQSSTGDSTAYFGGKVGMGTIAPNARLHIKGTDNSWDKHIRLENHDTTDYAAIVLDSQGMKFRTFTNTHDFYFRDNDNNTLLQIQDGAGIKFNNAYEFPTSDGSNGQVLTTNGSGTLTFEDAGGGSSVKEFVIFGEESDFYISSTAGAGNANGFFMAYGNGVHNTTRSSSGSDFGFPIPKDCTLVGIHMTFGNNGSETNSSNQTITVFKNEAASTTTFQYNASGTGGNVFQKSFTSFSGTGTSFSAGDTFNLRATGLSGYTNTQVGPVRVAVTFRET